MPWSRVVSKKASRRVIADNERKKNAQFVAEGGNKKRVYHRPIFIIQQPGPTIA